MAQERTAAATTVIVADGIGSGIKAGVAASMCVARLLELMRLGFSVRRAATSLVETMEAAKTEDLPYAAFSIARILNDGETTVLTYEAPGAILVGRRLATELPRRALVLERVVAEEANCHLEPGEGVLLMSDGVTQAGLGGRLRRGWQMDGVTRFVAGLLGAGQSLQQIPRRIVDEAVELSVGTVGDDVTAALAACRWGRIVNLLTGPPGDRRRDREVAQRFLALEGSKVVCGATTADVVARYLGVEVGINRASQSLLAPPSYVIPGVDLVTEGAVTLNQLYNVLDADPESFDEDSGVTGLHELLRQADRVNILLGEALNPANRHISFQQRGILPRRTIIDLIAAKLREMGKLVVVEEQ